MEILLAARPANRSADTVLITGTTDTGFHLGAADFGNAVWQKFYSEQRGTQGARLAGATPQNRTVTIPLEVVGDNQDDLQRLLSVLWGLDADFRRYGGTLTWRPQGGSFKQYFDVLDAGAQIDGYDRKFYFDDRVNATLGFVCAPYLRGDPYDIFDGFDTDTSPDWTKDADAAAMQIGGGTLWPLKVGGVRWRHTGRGYVYGDVQATLKITTGSSIIGYEADLFVNGSTTGADTHISAQLFGGNLRIISFDGGSQTVLASTGFAFAASSTYWLRIRREGRRVTAAVYTSEPTPLATAAATTSTTLTATANLYFGPGHSGIRLNVVSAGERYDDFHVEPFTYGNNLLAPDERNLRPAIIGDAPALADLVTTQSGGSSVPAWALFGWWPRPKVWNYIWNGDFEDDVDGWSVAAVSGVVGAATSIARNTTAARNKYGSANAQIVCPATSGTGASFKINRRFYQGRTYVMLVWASSAAQTTNASALLGVSGDLSSANSFALSTTPTLFKAYWTPTADRDGAYAAFEITAATGTTLNIDAVSVFEARESTLTNTMDASQTTVVVDSIPDDWPSPPFLAVALEGFGAPIEIMRVEAIDPKTRTLTFTRFVEGTTGTSHASGNTIFPLPEFRYQYEGKGAQPPVGVIEAESDDVGNRFTFALEASAAARLGNHLRATGLNGAGSAAFDILVDPHLLIPDDYTQGEIALEVWARINLHSGLDSPIIRLQVGPENATLSSGVMTSNYGAIRYAEEWGIPGKNLIKPSAGEVSRFTRVGTVRLPVDPRNPLRSRLAFLFAWGAGTASGSIACDYIVLCPTQSRCLSASGKPAGSVPDFIASTAETTKTIRSDLSGLVAKPPFAPQADHGLGGSLIEFPPGPVDCFLKLSNVVPDDPTSDTTGDVAERPAGVVHLAVTPRFTLARSS